MEEEPERRIILEGVQTARLVELTGRILVVVHFADGEREREREYFRVGKKSIIFFVKMINILWWEYKRVCIEESNFLIIFYSVYQSRRSNRLIN